MRCDDVGGKANTKFFWISDVTKQDSRSEAGEEAGRLLLFFWFLAVRRFFWKMAKEKRRRRRSK